MKQGNQLCADILPERKYQVLGNTTKLIYNFSVCNILDKLFFLNCVNYVHRFPHSWLGAIAFLNSSYSFFFFFFLLLAPEWRDH